MPIPNLNDPTKVEGKNVLVPDVSATASAVLTNSSGSNKTLRISSIYVSNIDGTNAADIDLYIFIIATSTIAYLGKTVSVPADAALLPLTKDSCIYLMEDQALYLKSSVAGDLSVIVNYEEIS